MKSIFHSNHQFFYPSSHASLACTSRKWNCMNQKWIQGLQFDVMCNAWKKSPDNGYVRADEMKNFISKVELNLTWWKQSMIKSWYSNVGSLMWDLNGITSMNKFCRNSTITTNLGNFLLTLTNWPPLIILSSIVTHSIIFS